MPVRFITFEGGEGSGKSTQARLLVERLQAEGIDALLTREPGGSQLGEQIRTLILESAGAPRSVLAETLLFYAARADHLEKLIRPALAGGRWVICDRFSDSTRVYQGVAGGLKSSVFDTLEEMVVFPTTPDLTFVLDIEPATGLKRANERPRTQAEPDAFEKRDLAYHQCLREGFRAVAAAHPRRCRLLDATREPQAIAVEIWRNVAPLARTP
jgi:dTMP kinase